MKLRKLTAGVALVALLAGCAGPGGEQGGGDPTPGGLGADPDDMAYLSADIRRDAALLTVDGAEISAETYLFWLVNSIETQKMYGGLATDEDWEEAYEDETLTGTFSDALKLDALETAKFFQIIRNQAEERGIVMSPEEDEDLDSQLRDLMEQSGGEETYRGNLEGLCITPEGYRALNSVQYLMQDLQAKMEEDGELTASDKELEEYIRENGIYAAKHILISTRKINEEGTAYEDFSDEEKAEAYQKALDLRQQLADGGDSEELFDALMNEHSEDGRDGEGNLYAPDGYTYVTPGRMVPQFEEGAMALEVGEIGDPVQTSYGYHIILRIPVDGEQARSSCESEKFNQIAQDWMDNAVVETTAAYDALVPKEFYDRLQAVTAARQEARAQAESGDEGAQE